MSLILPKFHNHVFYINFALDQRNFEKVFLSVQAMLIENMVLKLSNLPPMLLLEYST